MQDALFAEPQVPVRSLYLSTVLMATCLQKEYKTRFLFFLTLRCLVPAVSTCQFSHYCTFLSELAVIIRYRRIFRIFRMQRIGSTVRVHFIIYPEFSAI